MEIFITKLLRISYGKFKNYYYYYYDYYVTLVFKWLLTFKNTKLFCLGFWKLYNFNFKSFDGLKLGYHHFTTKWNLLERDISSIKNIDHNPVLLDKIEVFCNVVSFEQKFELFYLQKNLIKER